MWNNSNRTPTERWQKTSDFEKEGRALPKRAPETGASTAISSDHRDGHEMLTLLCSHQEACVQAQVTIHTPLGACAARHCQGPMIQRQVPWENTWCASGCCNITPASAAAGSPCIPVITSVPPSPQAWIIKSPLISHCFNPILSGWEQMPEGNLHAEAGPNLKLNPRSCANREEKGKSLPAASGVVD